MAVTNHIVRFGPYSAEELISEFGSPLYVYERENLEEKFKLLEESFTWRPMRVYYACKANTNPEILKIFRMLGAGIDAVSPGEIYIALRAGYKSKDMLLTGTNLSADDVLYAQKKQVMINLDSLSFLRRFADSLSGKRVSLRLNPDIKAGGHSYLETGHSDSKFGISPVDMETVLRICKKYRIRIAGLHQHIGSEVEDHHAFVKSLRHLFQYAAGIPGLEFIDIGGGFKVKYHVRDKAIDIHKLGRAVSERFTTFCNEYGKPLKLILEPGKYLVTEAGCLLTTVQSVKKAKSKVFVGTDTGMNHLIRPALYGAFHKIVNASNPHGKKETVTVVGNICESADVLGSDRRIARIREGDVLCIMNAGAYGFAMASMYNSRPLPAEVLVSRDGASLIRRRQRFRDFIG
jgi:diaminopimelate decarboxylase